MRELILAVLLAVATTLVSIGAGRLAPGAGLIVAGLGLGLWSWLVLGNLE